MKKSILKWMILPALFIIALIGCNKETNVTEDRSYEDAITAMAKQAVSDMDAQEVFSDNTKLGIYMQNEGIPAVFLVDDTDLTGDDSERTGIRRHAFIACLRTLALTEEQKPQIREDLRVYNNCTQKAATRAKAIYNELHGIYKAKSDRLYNAFITGTITEREYKKQLAELRIAFKRELRSMHLREKLDDAFTRCFRILLAELHGVLTDRQWNAFVECYRR